MQTLVIWNCDAAGPFSFSCMRSVAGAGLLAGSRGGILKICSGVRSGALQIARLRRELAWIRIPFADILPVREPERDSCCIAAARFLTCGDAYCSESRGGRAVLFRLPERAHLRGVMESAGRRSMVIPARVSVEISRHGILWRHGDGSGRRCSFAAMPDLILRRGDGRELFSASEHESQLKYGKRFRIDGAVQAEFSGRNVFFRDSDGAAHHFPMEQLENPEIVDESGIPSPLLMRVMTAIEHGNDIQAGDGMDEREAALQTLLFDAFEYPAPAFQLLPKADVEDAPDWAECRRIGVSPEVLFHELARMVCGLRSAPPVLGYEDWLELYRNRPGGWGYWRFVPSDFRELHRAFYSSLLPEEFARRAMPYGSPSSVRDSRFRILAEEMHRTTTYLSEAAGWHF